MITSKAFFLFRKLAVPAFVSLACSLGVSAQSSDSIFDEEPIAPSVQRIPDRVEGFNRAIFRFNDVVYRYTFRPFARGYVKVVPPLARRGINSFFHNLAYPKRFVGNLLEGEVDDAVVETGRFVVNSITTLGFANTANRIEGMEERPSDIGTAFRKWGIGHGSYLVLPLIGPTSIRDGVGEGIASAFLDPVELLDKWEHEAIASGVRLGNQTPDLMRNYDLLKEASIDPYVALREAYAARRAFDSETSSLTVPALPAEVLTEPDVKP